jgi:2-isopropylmalate synthase
VTRVLVDTSDGERRWSTVGAAPSILDASFEAVADGIEYGLSVLGSLATSPADTQDRKEVA